MHTNNAVQINNSERLTRLLETSTDQYTDILRLMETIAQSMDCNKLSDLTDTGNELLQKQQTAAATDNELMDMLRKQPEERLQKQIRDRYELLKKIMVLNKLIMPQLASTKSFIFNELQQIKTGRTAIKGYQQSPKKHGKNLKNSF